MNRRTTLTLSFTGREVLRRHSLDHMTGFGDAHLRRILAGIMHHAALFCTSGELTRADVPSRWVGVRQLVMQRVWG